MKKIVMMLSLCVWSSWALAAPVAESIYKQFSPQGQAAFNAEHGKALWTKKNTGEDGKERSCATCHGGDLLKPGKHIETGKVIEAMAPSVNKERYTDIAKIEKWFKRNCKWTYGRECTSQEKGDILKYLSQF